MWEEFIRVGKAFRIDRERDPYWDPESHQVVAYGHVTLECLMFNISYEGAVSIVKGGKQVGKMTVHIYPTDKAGSASLSI